MPSGGASLDRVTVPGRGPPRPSIRARSLQSRRDPEAPVRHVRGRARCCWRSCCRRPRPARPPTVITRPGVDRRRPGAPDVTQRPDVADRDRHRPVRPCGSRRAGASGSTASCSSPAGTTSRSTATGSTLVAPTDGAGDAGPALQLPRPLAAPARTRGHRGQHRRSRSATSRCRARTRPARSRRRSRARPGSWWRGRSDVTLDHVTARATYGDGVYIVGHSTGRHDPGLHPRPQRTPGRRGRRRCRHHGRNAARSSRTGRSAIDLEPAGGAARSVHVQDNEVHDATNFLLAAGGAGVNVGDVWLDAQPRHRRARRQRVRRTAPLPPVRDPRHRQHRRRCVSRASTATLLRFERFDGVEVKGNRQAVAKGVTPIVLAELVPRRRERQRLRRCVRHAHGHRRLHRAGARAGDEQHHAPARRGSPGRQRGPACRPPGRGPRQPRTSAAGDATLDRGAGARHRVARWRDLARDGGTRLPRGCPRRRRGTGAVPVVARRSSFGARSSGCERVARPDRRRRTTSPADARRRARHRCAGDLGPWVRGPGCVTVNVHRSHRAGVEPSSRRPNLGSPER